MAAHDAGSAKRRGDQRLRSMLRHERQTVAMEVATALHHSRDAGPSPHAATYAEAGTQTAPKAQFIAPAPAAYITHCTSTSDQVCGTCGDRRCGGVAAPFPCRICASDIWNDACGRCDPCDGGADSTCSRGRACRSSSYQCGSCSHGRFKRLSTSSSFRRTCSRGRKRVCCVHGGTAAGAERMRSVPALPLADRLSLMRRRQRRRRRTVPKKPLRKRYK